MIGYKAEEANRVTPDSSSVSRKKDKNWNETVWKKGARPRTGAPTPCLHSRKKGAPKEGGRSQHLAHTKNVTYTKSRFSQEGAGSKEEGANRGRSFIGGQGHPLLVPLSHVEKRGEVPGRKEEASAGQGGGKQPAMGKRQRFSVT